MAAATMIYHRAGKIDQEGNVSAICFKVPRAIDLSRACWTIRDEAVTCPKCRKAMRDGYRDRYSNAGGGLQ